MPKRIDTRQELIELARELRVRPDWHEPDEQDVTATVRGTNFDNAGFWGRNEDGSLRYYGRDHQEIWVELFQEGVPVAEIDLATLFAFATGYEG